MRVLRSWAQREGLKPSETVYVARSRDRRALRFSESGDPGVERACRTHWVSPRLSERERERLAERHTGRSAPGLRSRRLSRRMSHANVVVGAHVAPERPLETAATVGADCVQIFLSDPQGWQKPPPREDAAELRASPLPLYVHAPYLINVCSPRSNVRYGSRKILQQTCDAAADVGAAAVIVHAGHADDGISEGVGRWARTLQMLESSVPVLIENTAGGTNAVARRFDALARLWEAISNAKTDVELGFCLDSCHAHAAGEELTGAVERVLRIVGRINLLHANDSRDPPGTGADRHANLGAGRIETEALREMIHAAGSPVVVETPGGTDELRADIEFVRAALVEIP
jgi:deoxyribonuclease-4